MNIIIYIIIYIAEWTTLPFGGIDNHPTHLFLSELKNKPDFNINFVNFEILLQNTLSLEKYNFYKSIKYSNRNKIYIGPNRLHQGVTNFLNIDLCIDVPIINAIIDYDNILEKIKNNIVDNSILLFSCSMPAKSLIHKSIEYNNNITCLDIGSGFDPMFFKRTRDGQLDSNIIKNYYIDLIK
jgi:hypothetical protein